jgi:malonyl-CoA O-methyltransferase
LGTAIRFAAQAALGKLVTVISAAEAYPLWAETYDHDSNPLVELEHRILKERLHVLPGERLIDLATGTGRWLEYALSHGAVATGADFCPEMLAVAAIKRSVKGRLACADLCALPFGSDSADLAVCSLALGYVELIELAVREMARVARRIVISDLHPEAVHAGWVRSFHANNATFEIRHYDHLWTQIEGSARAAGLRLLWKLDASFGEPERSLFEQAGKADAFIRAQQVPAILVSSWARG